VMQNSAQKIDVALHDIKPLVAVDDYSFYYFIALSIFVIVVFLGVIYLLYRYFKERKRVNIRKNHYKHLENIDINNPKQSAYELTKYGRTFAYDNGRNTKTYEELIEQLQKYKYKKDVPEFDSKTLRLIELYKGMIDV